jgi:hypothetical protein
MANGKKPQTTGEHIVSLYGHVTGVKKDVDNIRCTQKHIHEDIDKIHGKVDKLLYILIGALVSGVIAFVQIN